MTEFEKMRSSRLYTYTDADVRASYLRAKRLCARLQTLAYGTPECRAVLEELIPGLPASAGVCPPFNCDHGHGIMLGRGVVVNFNCTMLDGGTITIGDHTLIGPNCSFYTPTHPIGHLARRNPQETCLPITIGSDCWLGGNVTVCPGVTIGDRCIIAAGSVVVSDIPDDSLATGVPARVKRKLIDND